MERKASSFLGNFGYLTSPPTLPAKRDTPGWFIEHTKHIELSKNPRVGRVLLIGDDTFGALPNHPHIWSKYLAPRLTLNYGLYGDQTQHVLWRVLNGLVPLNVEIIVIYVGGNNLGLHKSKDIANAIACIAMVLREKKLNVKIVVCGLLPTYNTYSTHFGKLAIKKARNVNKYLKCFCKKGHISDCSYLKPDEDWLLPDGSLDTTYYLNGLTEKGNEKFTKSLAGIIEILNLGVKVEISSDSEIGSEEEPCLPSQHKTTSQNITMLRNSIKKKNTISPENKHSKRPRSSSSYLSNDSHSYKTKRTISVLPVTTQPPHHKHHRLHFSKSPLRCSKYLSLSRKNLSKSRSRSNSSGGSVSSRSISPVFTVKRGPDGHVSRSRSPPATEKCEKTEPKSPSKSPDFTAESIITPGARARSRSLSKCRSRSRSVSRETERKRWLKRAGERFSPDAKPPDSFEVKSCWDPSPTGGRTPELPNSESTKESQSTMKMYGLFLKELEEMSKKESNVTAPTSTNIKVEGS